MNNRNLRLTGNPFVDVGLGIIAAKQRKESINLVMSEDARAVVENLLDGISELKSLGVLARFWQNNSFTGINPGTLPAYKKVLEELSTENPAKKNQCCQVCGFVNVFQTANRSWFPLAGGGDDACTLPGLSGKWICADCFRAVVSLPYGCRFCSTGPYFIHVADPEWQVWAVEEGVASVRLQLSAQAKSNKELKETDTKLRGRIELLDIISGNPLWDCHYGKLPLPSGGASIIAFNNEKTANLLQVHLPAQALNFFAVLHRQTLTSIFMNWAARCSGAEYTDKTTKEKRLNPYFDQICDDLEQRRSVAPLVHAIVRGRAASTATGSKSVINPVLTKEEKKVLMLYEDKLLDKRERFTMLDGIAGKIKAMDSAYRDSFTRRLGNLRSKGAVMSLIREYVKSEDKYGLKLTTQECVTLNEASDADVVNLFYLLCVAEDEPKEG